MSAKKNTICGKFVIPGAFRASKALLSGSPSELNFGPTRALPAPPRATAELHRPVA